MQEIIIKDLTEKKNVLLLLILVVIFASILPPNCFSATPSVSVNGTIDFVKGDVSISGTIDSNMVVIKDGTQLISKDSKTFKTTFNVKTASSITVASKNGDGVYLTFTIPDMPSILKRLLPTMSFSFDTKTNEFKFGGKLTRRPPGSLKGSVSDVENKLSSTFDVANDGTFSSSIKINKGNNTIRSYVRYLLLIKVSLPDIKFKLGSPQVIKLTINNPKMYVNGISKEVDPGRGTTPIIKDSRTLLPIRSIVETLGGSISWDEATKKVTIKLNGKTIEMWINNPVAKVNGTSKQIDITNKNVKPLIINGRTMLPVRFISEELGAYVEWYSTTKEILVIYVGG